jgi:hypothetical protein
VFEMKPSFRLNLLAAALIATACAGMAPAQAATQLAQAPADTGIVANPEYEKAGQIAANAWLLLLDRKDWGTAWDASSSVFRENVPLAAWMDNVPRLRDPFGNFVERDAGEAVYKKTLGTRQGDFVTVFFNSKFAKNAAVTETVTTVRESDGRWRVTGYTAR